MGTLTRQFSLIGKDDMTAALAHAVSAVNQDIGDAGYSPAQFVLGK